MRRSKTACYSMTPSARASSVVGNSKSLLKNLARAKEW
jgi:hypothetical protein